MLKRSDYIALGIVCFVLGFIAISQYYASKNVNKLLQPENNEVMALEIEKVAKSNALLNNEVARLTQDLDDYKNSAGNLENSKQKMAEEMLDLSGQNGEIGLTGQGVVVQVSGNISTANLVDLINALKNIGAYAISVNGTRIMINSYISASSFSAPISISALGNSSVLESALKRKGGIIEQISNKNVNITVEKKNPVEILAGIVINFNYAKIVN